jgi:hypothetical protein
VQPSHNAEVNVRLSEHAGSGRLKQRSGEESGAGWMMGAEIQGRGIREIGMCIGRRNNDRG